MKRLAAVTLLGALALASCSFGGGGDHVFTAEFSRAVQVFPAVKVRVLGVDVGQVIDVKNGPSGVAVRFRVGHDVKLPAQVKAAVVPMSLLGERYIQLFPAYQGGPVLGDGATIPLSRTAVPAEPDELLRSLQDYLGGLDPATVGNFVTNAAQAVQGSGADLNRLIEHGTGVIATLATKRDDLAAIVVELDKLTKALSTRQAALGQLIDNYGAVVGTIDANRSALEGTIDGLNQASLQIASLLGAHLRPLHADVAALTRAGQTLDRNAQRFALTGKWARSLFLAASRATDYKHDWLRLGNQGQELAALILLRLEERLMELCQASGDIRCANPDWWAEHVPSLFCFDPSGCPKRKGSAATQLGDALGTIQGVGRRGRGSSQANDAMAQQLLDGTIGNPDAYGGAR